MKIYKCPYCTAQLNIDGRIVLAANDDSSERGLVLLSAELGDFTAHYSENFSLKSGDKLHFYCPVCQHSLEYKENKNLARILNETDGEEHTIIFSAIFGEQSTFQINEERTLTFGEHAVRYMDPDWYRKL